MEKKNKKRNGGCRLCGVKVGVIHKKKFGGEGIIVGLRGLLPMGQKKKKKSPLSRKSEAAGNGNKRPSKKKGKFAATFREKR